MARISAADAGGLNVLAFLDMLAWSELGKAIIDQSDDGYQDDLLAMLTVCAGEMAA